MKKFGIILLGLMLTLCVSACGAADGTAQKSAAGSSDDANTKTSNQSDSNIGKFDLKKGTVLLNSGYEMPILGIGCFQCYCQRLLTDNRRGCLSTNRRLQ